VAAGNAKTLIPQSSTMESIRLPFKLAHSQLKETRKTVSCCILGHLPKEGPLTTLPKYPYPKNLWLTMVTAACHRSAILLLLPLPKTCPYSSCFFLAVLPSSTLTARDSWLQSISRVSLKAAHRGLYELAQLGDHKHLPPFEPRRNKRLDRRCKREKETLGCPSW
jgi:hypothetical protein